MLEETAVSREQRGFVAKGRWAAAAAFAKVNSPTKEGKDKAQ